MVGIPTSRISDPPMYQHRREVMFRKEERDLTYSALARRISNGRFGRYMHGFPEYQRAM
jgi:hypothetical protein